MSFSVNLPIKEYKKRSLFIDGIYFLTSALTLVFISQTYRIILKDSDFLMLLRFTEDYLLLGALFFILIIKGRLKLYNLKSFLLLFVYLCISYLFVISDFDLIRRFTIIMLWYTIAINVVIYIKPKHFFYIIAFMGIFSAGTMLMNIEQTISDYVIQQNRLHAEGEGMDMNINNISLILVSLTAIASVIYKNISEIKFGKILMFALYLSVLGIILIGSTRSALIFYVLIAIYFFHNLPTRYIIIPLLLFLIFISTLIIFSDELVIISRFVQYDYATSGRSLALLDSLTNFSNNPFFGIGEIKQENMQLQQIGDPDHNFFTRLLGSNGIIGFAFIVNFLIGLIIPEYKNKHINGLFLLQLFFVYSLIFSPGGPGIIIIASSIFYISQFKNFDMNLKHS